MLWNDELPAGAIHAAMPDVTFGAVSLQLRALLNAGLVDARPDGRHRYYRASRTRLTAVADILEPMWHDALWRLKLQAELEETRRGPSPKRTRKRTKRRNS